MQSSSSKRTAVKRIPKRGHYDRETIDAILDEAIICHVGFAVEGQPYVIPTGFARVGDVVYIHGSAASRMLRELSKGHRSLRYGHDTRWTGAGAIGVSSLDELSVGCRSQECGASD
jgi:hypothetical protein